MKHQIALFTTVLLAFVAVTSKAQTPKKIFSYYNYYNSRGNTGPIPGEWINNPQQSYIAYASPNRAFSTLSNLMGHLSVFTDIDCSDGPRCQWTPIDSFGLSTDPIDRDYWTFKESYKYSTEDLYLSNLFKDMIEKDPEGYQQSNTLLCRDYSGFSIYHGVCTNKGCGKGRQTISVTRTLCTWATSKDFQALKEYQGRAVEKIEKQFSSFEISDLPTSHWRKLYDNTLSPPGNVHNKYDGHGYLNTLIQSASFPVYNKIGGDFLGMIDLYRMTQQHLGMKNANERKPTKTVTTLKLSSGFRKDKKSYSCFNTHVCSGYQLFEPLFYQSNDEDPKKVAPRNTDAGIDAFENFIAAFDPAERYATRLPTSYSNGDYRIHLLPYNGQSGRTQINIRCPKADADKNSIWCHLQIYSKLK